MKFILFAFSLSLSLSLSGGKSRQVGMGRGQNHLSLAWMLRIYSFFIVFYTIYGEMKCILTKDFLLYGPRYLAKNFVKGNEMLVKVI